ncbi:MAG: translation initiation factor 2 subunit 2 [Candidatus Diapherotrites archaeon]|nr:translation initiation factor 2 subunit 2 [Candidatus Diapherotrites archaeon]MDN5366703.1 translation initiation factor 2 subunit 2 [Candidatus Diapherotrites archaeon]
MVKLPEELEYERLLDRLYEKLPEEAKKPMRFEMPRAAVEIHGKTTLIRNAAQIAQIFRRDLNHFFKYITREMGTTGSIEGSAIRLKGRFGPATIQRKVEQYAKDYVLCPVCGKPDTHFIELRGVRMLKCEACGAVSPIPEL